MGLTSLLLEPDPSLSVLDVEIISIGADNSADTRKGIKQRSYKSLVSLSCISRGRYVSTSYGQFIK